MGGRRRLSWAVGWCWPGGPAGSFLTLPECESAWVSLWRCRRFDAAQLAAPYIGTSARRSTGPPARP
eukprot:11220837-Lingulodinium_polyedra.AAC.1